MIKITRITSGTSGPIRLHVDGRIVGKTVGEVEAACLAALEDDVPFVLDLAGVTFLDPTGVRSIRTLLASGTIVVGRSAFVGELLRADAERIEEPSSGDDETTLIASLHRGDQRAFATLVRLYGPRMLAVARRIVRREEDARDVVQEAFVSAFKALDSLPGNARLSTWLHRLVVDAALTRLRRQRRKPEESIGGNPEESIGRRPEESIDEFLPRFDEKGAWIEPPAHWVLPFELPTQRDTRAMVRECVQRLPKLYRTVLMLRDVEELDADAAAEALGISASTVKTRLHRARQALRTLLTQRLGRDAVAARAHVEFA